MIVNELSSVNANKLLQLIESTSNTSHNNLKQLRNLPIPIKIAISLILLVATMTFCIFILYILFRNPTFKKINYIFLKDDNKTPRENMNIEFYNSIWLTIMLYLSICLLHHYLWYNEKIQDVVNEFHLVSFFVMVFLGQMFIPVIMYYFDNIKMVFFFNLLMLGLSFQIIFFLVSTYNYTSTILYSLTMLWQIFNLFLVSEKF